MPKYMFLAAFDFLSPVGFHLEKQLSKYAVGEYLLNVFYNLTVDGFLVSFPKCGRTWVRLMLGKAFATHFELDVSSAALLDIEHLSLKRRGIPRIHVTHDKANIRLPHELKMNRTKYRGKKVIFLVRDPRDVIVSHYFQVTRRRRNKYFSGDMSTFIHHEHYGIERILRFMNIWYHQQNVPSGFLLVRYEDLKASPHNELKKIVTFLGLSGVREKTLRDAVEFTHFENMKKMERDGVLHSRKLQPRDLDDPETYKVRKGLVGGYRAYLSEDDIVYLNRKIETELEAAFGYGGHYS
ncbi:MAG: sulfotransferase domain-containing protein [Deltaproteobacteria bacterium]|nr:sulfotransferase domain-containing protein [Deltaproteobacteria bacterium]